jgi:hypothetical protein
MEKSITINLNCSNFPGLEFEGRTPVYVGVQKGDDIVDEAPGNAHQTTFSIPIRIKEDQHGNPDFSGPYVHGKKGERFVYLVWFENKGAKERFRRAKIKLNHLSWAHLQASQLEADVTMTDRKGGPISATLKEDLIRWNIYH